MTLYTLLTATPEPASLTPWVIAGLATTVTALAGAVATAWGIAWRSEQTAKKAAEAVVATRDATIVTKDRQLAECNEARVDSVQEWAARVTELAERQGQVIASAASVAEGIERIENDVRAIRDRRP